MSPHGDLIEFAAYALFGGAAIISLWWATLVWELRRIRQEMIRYHSFQRPKRRR